MNRPTKSTKRLSNSLKTKWTTWTNKYSGKKPTLTIKKKKWKEFKMTTLEKSHSTKTKITPLSPNSKKWNSTQPNSNTKSNKWNNNKLKKSSSPEPNSSTTNKPKKDSKNSKNKLTPYSGTKIRFLTKKSPCKCATTSKSPFSSLTSPQKGKNSSEK